MLSFISISVVIIIASFLVSYRGFKDHMFYEKYSFKIDAVKIEKDYKRFITSGFLHVNWMHLIFNMIALFLFSSSIENFFGPLPFLLIYFVSMIGGDLLS